MMSIRLPHHVTSAAAARGRVREAMAARRVGRRLADDVALVVSELVTNSVRHACPLSNGDLEVAWDVSMHLVEVRVTDGGGEASPVPRSVGPDDVTGRGLTIVTKLAAAWGVEDAPGGITVWALVGHRRRSVRSDPLTLT